jgi:hypothetical protein
MIISYTSISIARILVILNNINTTSTSIARILVRLDNKNNDIGSWVVFRLFVEGDAVASGDGRSSTGGGGTSPLKMRRAC